MSKKAMKQFKEKCDGNKNLKSEKKMKTILANNQLFTIPITPKTIAKVKSKTVRLEEDEVKELIQDIFSVKKNFKLEERIETSKFCNVCYDFCYKGAMLNDGVQEACFLVC